MTLLPFCVRPVDVRRYAVLAPFRQDRLVRSVDYSSIGCIVDSEKNSRHTGQILHRLKATLR